MHRHACHQSVSCESQEYKTGKSLFSNWCWKSWTATWKQMQLKHTLSLDTEITSKWLKDLNMIKTWYHKTPRREHGQNCTWHKLYQCFLRSVSQGNRNKNKSKQTYKLLHSKGNNKKKKKKKNDLRNGRKKFADDAIDKGLISKIHQRLIQLNNKKQTTQSKNGLKIFTFLQKKPIQINGHQACEKMLNITNYYRNANQNYNEVPLDTNQNGHH